MIVLELSCYYYGHTRAVSHYNVIMLKVSYYYDEYARSIIEVTKTFIYFILHLFGTLIYDRIKD